MKKPEQTIVHLHLHQPIGWRTEFYYRSIPDMYKKVLPSTIGVTQQTLRNCRFKENKFYANKLCTIQLITLE